MKPQNGKAPVWSEYTRKQPLSGRLATFSSRQSKQSWSGILKTTKMNNGNVEEFDGISLIVWTQDNKIKSLKEFGCNLHNYNPYRDSDIPVFREEKANWF